MTKAATQDPPGTDVVRRTSVRRTAPPAEAIAKATAMTSNPMELGQVLAASGFFQDVKDAAQAAVKVMAGQELGFPPIASITGVHIVDGKVGISANLMAAAVKRTGIYTFRIREHTDQVCSIEFFESGETLGLSTFTMEDAKRANLLNRTNWQRYPRNMLFARALSNGTKWHCPDVFGGPVYTEDELADISPPDRIEATLALPGAEATPATSAPDELPQVTADAPEPSVPMASAAQRRKIFAETRKQNLDEDSLRNIVRAIAGTPHTDRIPKSLVDAVLEAIADPDSFWATQEAQPQENAGEEPQGQREVTE